MDRDSVENWVAELTEKNEQLEKILNSLEEGLLLTDSDGKINHVSEPLLRMFQENPEGLLGTSIKDFLLRIGVPIEDVVRNLYQDRQTLSRDFFIEYPLPIWVRLYAVPFEDESGNLVGCCLTFKDITRLKQQEEERQHVEKLNTLLPLAAGLAHEIGNPLNSLTIHLQLAERDLRELPESKKKKIARNLQIAKEEIKRLDRIVSQFLGAIRPFKTTFKLKNINEVLDAALDFMAPEISLAKVTVERRFQTNLAPTLIDEDQLKQAFFNVIKNAVEAMPKGGLLQVQTQIKSQQIRISFADTGVGISKEKLDRIFEPYFSTKEKGTGLGLTIVSRVVTEHGGNIQVKSAPGKGTQFVIYLPILTSAKPLLTAGKPAAKKRKPKISAAV